MNDAETLAAIREALTSEDEIAHGEAWSDERGGLGVCAYCDELWPCRTQRGIDRALALLDAEAARHRNLTDRHREVVAALRAIVQHLDAERNGVALWEVVPSIGPLLDEARRVLQEAP